MDVVYLDELWAVNALTDGLLLALTARLLGVPPRRGRLALAAALGGVYAAACLLPGLGFLASPGWKLLSSAGLCLTAFGSEDLLRSWGAFLAVSARSADDPIPPPSAAEFDPSETQPCARRARFILRRSRKASFAAAGRRLHSPRIARRTSLHQKSRQRRLIALSCSQSGNADFKLTRFTAGGFAVSPFSGSQLPETGGLPPGRERAIPLNTLRLNKVFRIPASGAWPRARALSLFLLYTSHARRATGAANICEL